MASFKIVHVHAFMWYAVCATVKLTVAWMHECSPILWQRDTSTWSYIPTMNPRALTPHNIKLTKAYLYLITDLIHQTKCIATTGNRLCVCLCTHACMCLLSFGITEPLSGHKTTDAWAGTVPTRCGNKGLVWGLRFSAPEIERTGVTYNTHVQIYTRK